MDTAWKKIPPPSKPNTPPKKKLSWWLNFPPLWKNMRKSKLPHLPHFSGWKFQTYLSCHHPKNGFDRLQLRKPHKENLESSWKILKKWSKIQKIALLQDVNVPHSSAHPWCEHPSPHSQRKACCCQHLLFSMKLPGAEVKPQSWIVSSHMPSNQQSLSWEVSCVMLQKQSTHRTVPGVEGSGPWIATQSMNEWPAACTNYFTQVTSKTYSLRQISFCKMSTFHTALPTHDASIPALIVKGKHAAANTFFFRWNCQVLRLNPKVELCLHTCHPTSRV